MSEEEDKPSREDRTIFIPGGGSQLIPGSQPPADPAEAQPEVESGGGTASQPAVESRTRSDVSPAVPPIAPAASVPPAPTSMGMAGASPGSSWGAAGSFQTGGDEARRIQIGDVLNHIFEVRRFIARGGMGEVFEGINVNTEERVAIKVILPHLAADPAVQAMFRKEARTLTRLSHPGLVQYRVLAQEPNLRALYIVTEYIDGPNLSDQMATLNATPAQLIALLRKLAEGLAAAHSLGAIHRDISPDNIMLDGGRLERAKIIDFGIAKDLDAVAGSTIVGDGFAGKLNYVAPEQLGDFDREVGPWTDVYSLGLTMMSMILGRDVNMGATLVDAVDKRRAGLDVSAAPEELQPVLERMLKGNPAERLRSMEEVLHMLSGPGMTMLGGSLPVIPADHASGASGGGSSNLSAPGRKSSGISPKLAMGLAGGGAAVLIAGALAFTFIPRGGDVTPAPGATVASDDASPVAPPADPLGTARRVVETEIRTAPCSWLDIADIKADGAKIALSMHGVSGESARAMGQISDALKRVGLQAPSIDMDVSPIPANMCRPIEAFNQIRAGGAGRLSVAQHKFEMDVLPASAGPDGGKLGAQAVFTLNLAGLTDDMTLVGLDEAGEMKQMAATKSEIIPYLDPLPNETYHFRFNTTHTGWSGILMLTGKGPFDASLTGDSKSRDDGWADRFLKEANERGWRSEMVWYRVVDEVGNSR
jgi:serine/threonine-protein kinase